MRYFEVCLRQKTSVMLNAVKHLYRFIAMPFNGAVEMLRLRCAARSMTDVFHLRKRRKIN
jgi:hypothetical protein